MSRVGLAVVENSTLSSDNLILVTCLEGAESLDPSEQCHEKLVWMDTYVAVGASLSHGRLGLHASDGDGGSGIHGRSRHLASGLEQGGSLKSNHGRNSANGSKDVEHCEFDCLVFATLLCCVNFSKFALQTI